MNGEFLKYIKFLKELSKKDVALVGGKGANLGEMYNIGLPVPDAFVVTSFAYKQFLEKTKLSEDIFEILKTTNVNDSDELQKNTQRIRSLIEKTKMPEEIEKEICEAYEKLSKEYKTKEEWVVARSSATAEDLPSIHENEHVLIKIDGEPIYDEIGRVFDLLQNTKFSVLEVPAMVKGKIKWMRADKIYKHPCKDKKLYKIKTKSGREITISPNHTLLVLDEDNFKPKVANISELVGNEKVPVISKLPELEINKTKINVLDYLKEKNVRIDEGRVKIENSINWKIQHGLPMELNVSEDLAYFFGIYLSDGSTYKNNCVSITNFSP